MFETEAKTTHNPAFTVLKTPRRGSSRPLSVWVEKESKTETEKDRKRRESEEAPTPIVPPNPNLPLAQCSSLYHHPLPNTQSLSGQTHDELPCQQNSFRDQLIQQKWTRAISRWKTQCKESKVAYFGEERERAGGGSHGEKGEKEQAREGERKRECMVEVSLTEIGHLML